MRVGYFLRWSLKASGCILRNFTEHFLLRQNLRAAMRLKPLICA